ncbi:MAG: hypothetical protein F7C32_03560 [Desulfurococcales archaeon]|nr:hypothetical protein [Desulfurococcales archaeon]
MERRNAWDIYQSLGLGSYVMAGLAGYYIGGLTIETHMANSIASLLAGIFIGLSTWKLKRVTIAAILTGLLGPGLLFLARMLDAPNMLRLSITGAMFILPWLYSFLVILLSSIGMSILWWSLLEDKLSKYYH